MTTSKSFVRVLALVLILAMLLPSATFAALKDTAGGKKAKAELVYMEIPEGKTFPEVTTTKTVGWQGGETFYVGVMVSDLSNIEESESGMYMFSTSIVYDDTYLELEPDYMQELKDLEEEMKEAGEEYDAEESFGPGLVEAWNKRMKGQSIFTLLGQNVRYTFTSSSAVTDVTSDVSTVSTARVHFQLEYYSPTGAPNYKGAAPALMNVIQFRVKQAPSTDGKKVFDVVQTTLGGSTPTQVSFGTGGKTKAYSANTTVAENLRLLSVMDFSSSGVSIFPTVPTLTATTSVAVKSGETGVVYGNTLVATASNVKDGDGATVENTEETTNYTLQWQRGTVAEGNTTWADISDATGDEYKLAAADIGKKIRCVLTSSTYSVKDTGSTWGETADTVDKRTLNLSGDNTKILAVWTVKDDSSELYIWTDDTATQEKPITKTVGPLNFPDTKTTKDDEYAAMNIVKGDQIRFSQIAFEYKNATKGTPALVGTPTLATTGDTKQTACYKFADNDTVKVTGLVKESTFDSIAITDQPSNINTAYDLTGDKTANVDVTGLTVTKTFSSGKTEELSLDEFLEAGGKVMINDTVVASKTVSNNSVAVSPAMKGKAFVVSLGEGDDEVISTPDKNAPTLKVDTDATVVSWEVTQKDFTYEDGDVIDLDGVTVTATMDDGLTQDITSDAVFMIGEDTITVDETTANMDMDGATITVVYGEDDPKTVGTITVTAKTSVNVVVTAGEAADKDYDGKTDGVVWTTEPVFTPEEGYELDASEAVYAYASAGAADSVNISVSGLKFSNAANSKVKLVDSEGNALTYVGAGKIAQVVPEKIKITFKNNEQYLGKVTAVTAVGDPESTETGDKLVVEYEVVTKEAVDFVEGHACECTQSEAENPDEVEHDAGCPYVKQIEAADAETEWKTWEDASAYLNGLKDPTTVKVRAYVPATGVNYKPNEVDEETNEVKGATDGTLTLKKQTGGGGGGIVVPDPTHAAYIIGDDNGMFRPNDGMTRAEAAVILARVSDDFDENKVYTTTLADVSGHWGANWIGFAASKGIVVGDQGLFRPNDGVTRAEMATMVARFVGLAPNYSASAFADTNGHWAEGYIAALKAAGIVIGDGGNFRPDAAISRAEAVTMINRALGRTPTAAKVNDAVSGSPFYDVKRSDWFFAQVVEAAETHKVKDYHA